MAKYTAQWGPKGFIVSPGKVVPLKDISTGYTLKAESNNDTSGTPPTNTRGRELQVVTLQTSYIAAAGVSPRAQLEEWGELIGEKYPLYIQGQRFGPKLLQLEDVRPSNIVLDNIGRFVSLDLALTLREYIPPATKVSAKAFSGAAKSAGSTGSAAGKSAPSKGGALAAKPSSEDRKVKKPTLAGRMVGAGVSALLKAAGVKK